MENVKRNRTEWREINLLEVKGMSTNLANPGSNYAQRILNAYVDEHPGSLTLRDGYELKYSAPKEPTIINDSFLNFDLFYDKQVDTGQEITCLIQKGTLQALDNSGSPVVSDTINGFWFWCVPHYNISRWQDSYQWVNKTIITKIVTGSDSTYPNMIKIFGNLSSHGLKDGSLDRWVIYNKTKNEKAQIISCKADGSNLRIVHTLYNSAWDSNDVIIASKYWVPLDEQLNLYNYVNAEDISFHTVNNDIRIGFGGKSKRNGIAIGYRNTFNQIDSFDFENIHPDLTQTQLEKFCEINELVLDSHILEKNAYGLELEITADGSLPEDEYHFRLTGKMDNYAEQLLAEDSIVAYANSKIRIKPYAILGEYNPRITSFKLYVSTDLISYYRIQEHVIRDKSYNKTTWDINKFSRLALIETLSDYHSESNAASIDNESNGVGSWVVKSSGTISVATEGDGASSYSLEFTDFTPGEYKSDDREGIVFPITGIKKGDYYTISFSAKSRIPYKKLYVCFAGASLSLTARTQKMIEAKSSTWETFEVELLADNLEEDVAYLVISVCPEHGNDIFCIFGNDLLLTKDYGSTSEMVATSINDQYPILLGDRMLTMGLDKIYASFDFGKTWGQLGDTFTGVYLYTMKLIGDDIYVGTDSGGIWKSTDRGATFTEIISDVSGGSSYAIRDVAKNSLYLYAATLGGGIYRSDDGGVTWTASNTGITTHTEFISIYADDSGLVAVALYSSALHLWRSIDNGDNWTTGASITGEIFGNFLFDGTYLYLSTYALGSTDGGLWESDNYFNTATEISLGYSGVERYNGLFLRNGTIYLGYGTTVDNAVFYTSNQGNTFNELLTDEITDIANIIGDDNTFWVDLVSIKQDDKSYYSSTSANSVEMSAELNYVPDADLVLGWDMAIALRGRIYYLNPFVKDRRYENYLLVSHLHSDGSYMWDIASFSNYRELERFNANISIGLVVLPTAEIMILKNNSIEILSDDGLTGYLREPIFGIGCSSKNTIVNLSGTIAWAGDKDIYTYSPNTGVQGRLIQTIRDIYQAIVNKSELIAIRDRYNSYRIRVNDKTEKTEFLFFNDFNVVEERKYHFPEIYREDIFSRLNFLNNGDIYAVKRPLDKMGYGKLYSSKYGEYL